MGKNAQKRPGVITPERNTKNGKPNGRNICPLLL